MVATDKQVYKNRQQNGIIIMRLCNSLMEYHKQIEKILYACAYWTHDVS